jgi:hypothetical protein
MVRNAVEGDYADGTGTKSRVYCFNNSLQAILNGNFHSTVSKRFE